MQTITSLLGLVAAATLAVAAPAPAKAVSAMAAVPQWTIEGFVRTCNSADTSCTHGWTRTIRSRGMARSWATTSS